MDNRSLWSVFKIATTYAGTMMGAGFASGQELQQFFAIYGQSGLWGLAVAGGLFAFLGSYSMEKSARLQATSDTAIFHFACGKRLGHLLSGTAACFLFSLLCIMLAGAGTLARDTWQLPFVLGTALFMLILLLTSVKGLSGITWANGAITPLLTAATLSVACAALEYHWPPPFFPAPAAHLHSLTTPHWLLSALLYVSYNLMMALTVLVPLGRQITDPFTRAVGCLAGGFLLTLLASLITLTLALHSPEILEYEIPMLQIAALQHPLQEHLYLFILAAAMYTTALASLFGCAGKLQRATGWSLSLCLLVLAAAAMVCCQVGFTSLIGLLFPLFGYISLLFTLRLLYLRCLSK